MRFETSVATASCTLIGFGLLIYGLYQRRKLRESRSWPRVQGTITRATIGQDNQQESNSYLLLVKYDYVVDGARYTGTRIGFSERTYLRKKRAQAELDRYPVSSGVSVYFDPRRPADAVLVREYPDIMILIVSAVFLLGLALVMLMFGRG